MIGLPEILNPPFVSLDNPIEVTVPVLDVLEFQFEISVLEMFAATDAENTGSVSMYEVK